MTPAEPGSDLVLTLRTSIQFAAAEALQEAIERTGARAGSVVVLDPATGGVLAMVNLPGFDPDGSGVAACPSGCATAPSPTSSSRDRPRS